MATFKQEVKRARTPQESFEKIGKLKISVENSNSCAAKDSTLPKQDVEMVSAREVKISANVEPGSPISLC